MEQRRQCPGCKTPLKVPEAAAGKPVRCPRCQSVIPPAAAAKTAPVDAVRAAEDEAPAARRTPSRARDEEGKKRPAKAAVQAEGPDSEIEQLLARGKKLSLRLKDFSTTIQDRLHDQLTPQEQIVWVGRPTRRSHLPLLLLMVFLALAIGGLLLAVGWFYELPTAWTLLFAAAAPVGFAFANAEPVYRVLFPGSICYVLTSRRTLACVRYPFWSFSPTQVFGFKEGPSAYPRKKAHWLFRNVGTLFMGDAIFLPIQTFLGMTKISRAVYGFVGIDNIDAVDELVRGTLQPRSKSKAVWPKANKAFVIFGFVLAGVMLLVMGGVVALIFALGGGGGGPRHDYYKEALAEREQKAGDDKIRQVAWKVRPDAGPVPGGSTASAIPAGGGIVVFPGSPAGFVAVNLARNPKEYAVYDLASGRQVGDPHVLKIADGTRPALSQDGQTLALRVEGRTDLVEVRDVQRRGRPLHVPFDKDSKDGFTIGDLRFAGKERLVVVLQKGEAGRDARTIFAVFNVASKKHESRFDGSFRYEGRRAALSPGGNFLVMHPKSDQNFLYFWDLGNGEVAGTLEIAAPADPEGETAGLAFSPDGKSVALLWKTKAKGWGRLLCWDIEAHKRVADHALEQAPPGADTGGGYPLQFLPDGSGLLLFGHLIIDRDKGTITGKVGPEPANAADAERVVVDRGHVGRFKGGARPALEFLNLPGKGG
jgi:LSD1 subclass zinc finger protein